MLKVGKVRAELKMKKMEPASNWSDYEVNQIIFCLCLLFIVFYICILYNLIIYIVVYK